MSTNKKPTPAMAKQNKKSDTPTGGGGGKDLKVMPTATLEQIQIAKIIDTHRQEDPDLQTKIRQVMDITRTTEDEACKALHSREYDIDEAITLLVEGKSSEWEEAKRRKGKQQGGKKQGGAAMERSSDPTPHPKDSPSDINRGGYARGSSRGRSSTRGNYRQADNKENDEQRTGRYVPRGIPRGGRDSGRGRGAGRDATSRTFASKKVTSGGADFNHPIDVWENSQAEKTGEQSSGGGGGEAMKVEKWDEFPSAEDWDNEEYTGSLAESKVFTPSTQQQQQQQTNTTAVSATPATPATTTDSRANGIMSLFDTKKTYGNGDTTEQQQRILHGQVVAGQSIDLSLLLQKPVIEQSYSNVTTQQQQQGEQQQQRNKQRVATGATVRQQQISKIPPSGVEMPDDSSLSQLDVQFGGMEFGPSAFNSVQSHQESQQPKPSSPFQNRQMTDVTSNELSKSQQQSQHNQYQQGSAFVSYAAKGGAPGFPAPVVTSSVVVTQQQQQQSQGQQSQAPTYTNISQQQHYQQPYNNYQPSTASVSTTPYQVIPQLSYNQMSNQQQPGYYSQYNSYSQKYTQQQQSVVKEETTTSPAAATTTTQPTTAKLTTSGPTLTTATTKATIPPIPPTQSLPPGMMLHPQYIVNQGGLPLYGFQAPLYGYDENSTAVQFLPRLPHPGLTSYYDTSYAPPPPNPQQTSRPDPYPSSDRYQRPSDTSTASPIPSSQQQQIYNPALPQYYYVGNNMIHGAFPYGPPPAMYQSSPAAAATPGVASAGSAGSAGGVPSANQQSQYTTTTTNKYMGNYYDQQPSGVEYKYKQSDLGNYKGQQHKINSYDKPYTSTGMYGNPLPAGQTQLNPAGMGFGVYLPSDNQQQQQQQRQSNPKQNTAGKQQFGNQPYWTGGN